MGRAATSLEALSAVIADIHDAGADGTVWPGTLGRIGALLNSPTIALWVRDGAGRLENAASIRPDPQAAVDYAGYYHRLDRLNPALARSPVGTVLTSRMVMPQEEFARTEFYNDFARRYDMDECMQGHIFDGPGGSGHFGLVRPSRLGAFERDDMRLLGLLLPHLRRALQTRQTLADLGLQRDSALEALGRLGHGVLIVDARACVIYANPTAEAVLNKGDGLGVDATDRRRLCAPAPARTGALHRLIAQAAARDGTPSNRGGGSGAIRLDRAAGDPLLLNVAPVPAGLACSLSPRPAVWILIHIPEAEMASILADLRARFDLTPTEAAVAEVVSRGRGAKDAAAALGMAPSTLRWHLKTVFDRTGTARQAELARLVERLRRALPGG